jgi:uncharacterized protein
VESLKLLFVFLLIVFALRRKLSVGPTMFFAGIVAAFLYQIPVGDLLNGYWDLLKSRRFLSITGVIVLVTTLGTLLKELGYLQRLADACRGLVGGRRTAAALMPPLVGLMPMPGGALLSAPLIESVLIDPKYRAEFKAATNYWFRHIVEFSWPVYPGLILTEAVTGLPIGSVALLQSPLTIGMLVIGIFFFSRQIDGSDTERHSLWTTIRGVAFTIWPIALAIAIYGVFRIDLALAVLIALIIMVLIVRPPLGVLKMAAGHGISFKLFFLTFGILSFQTVLELSGAINSIPRLSTQMGLPPEIIIFLVCFTIGLLTGMVAAYVGLGYTLLAGFLYQPTLSPGHILIAYLSGYLGMMVSPTHLCLILTTEYFKANLGGVYRLLVIPLVLLALLGGLLFVSTWPRLIWD